ncbi:MAG TPA: hypothetical protein VLA59_10265 [Patescibacteria group bacterium]|nr:hypothetical protein [Patescibacteria group bacterium]
MRSRRFLPVLGAVVLVLGSLVPAAAPPVRAAEYSMETRAAYVVRPDQGVVDVTVTITFTNTTPDPEGQFSVFDELKIAVHDEATAVAAEDDEGELDVEVAVENDVNVATVALRDDLRYEESAELTVTWTLADSEDPQLRVRPSVVVFPAWGFGTASEVRVEIPSGYEVRVDGDLLEEEGDALTSGPIEDPSRWLALITALRPVDYVNLDANVPLGGGTADLRVRAFADDEAWGQRTLALLVDALPLIEEEVGLPYPRIGQLIVTETVATGGSGFGEQANGGTEIAVAFDQPPFTAVHQVTHVWISPALVESRWLREGLTSLFAARVSEALEVELPFNPGERAGELSEAAFPLDAWTADAGVDGEAYGYAASWAFVEQLEALVGDEPIRTVLARVAGGIGPYQSADVEPDPLPDGVAAPKSSLATRSFLDQLETVSGQALSDVFAERVLTEGDVALLPERAEARAAFDDLVEAGGSWQAPDPVRGAMTAWQFADARAQIEDAAAWLERRDELLAAMQAVGLSAPDRLRQAYRTYGGGPEAVDELEAEQAVVDAYTSTAAEVNGERSFVERIGLIGGPDPATQLNLANGRFADGDLRGAIEAVTEAQRIVASAETGGIVRIASAVLVIFLVLALAVLLVRRRTSYTAAP